MTIEVKAIDQYFLVVLFMMLYKVVLTFDSVRNETILKFSCTFLSCCLLYNNLPNNTLVVVTASANIDVDHCDN